MIAIATRVEPFPPLSKLRGWLKLGGIALAAASPSPRPCLRAGAH